MSPFAIVPPTNGEQANYTVMVGGSPCKVGMVGDAEEAAKCESSDQLFEHALQSAYPYMVNSVKQRGIEPRGEWALVILPLDTDYHEVLDESVWSRIDEHLAREPDLRVLYVCMIVDSESVTTFLNGELN